MTDCASVVGTTPQSRHPCQRCQQPNTSSRISASGVKDADFVESFLRRWHSRSCFRIDGQKMYREPKGKIVRKMFKYRLYPTRPQTEALMVQLSEACRLYNAALQERIEAYRTHHKSINYYDQAAQLTEIRKAGDLGLPNCHCAQDVLRRLEKAFKAFFQRIKRGQKPGFPCFKSSRRYDSITFPSHGDGNKLLSSGHLFVQGVGNIKVKLHARCTARLRPSRSSENANTGTSASQSKLLCSHCPRQKQPWASTLVCLLSQRCQTTPRLKTRGCIAKRRRNFVVPNVV